MVSNFGLSSPKQHPSLITFVFLLPALGAAYGIAKTATGIGAISMMKPDLIIKGMVPVVMAGIVAIYGLVIAVLIANQGEFMWKSMCVSTRG